MNDTITSNQRNVATLIHLSTFSKYIFPFGNFIFPLVLWLAQRKESKFMDDHGRRALNFQISILLYAILLVLIAGAVAFWQIFSLANTYGGFDGLEHHWDHHPNFSEITGGILLLVILGAVAMGFFIFELVAVISASVKAHHGQPYKYPLTINFIGASSEEIKTETTTHTSENNNPSA